ncbi:transglycosylase domain-containing protein [Fluviicola sp.]|jgi:penicillin-binding protein 1A|uniref:transglycosylase domain-containing protein n=1 Tax=Fluviicola sp. TaxID=1917219 RepID=UPI00283189C5|nr:transglycosylase domain-containing protein [Fluviicola sp.]MDR0802747.1 penicillin-binding protein [Fluviicola sp.]
MDKELDGYIVYSEENNKRKIPVGVVSNTYECISTIDDIPKQIKDFTVGIEDKRFYKHKGIDVRGIARATIANIKHRKIKQGGSTITQQLARNLLRNNEKTISRKVKETIKAIQIEKHYSKEEILNLYFNNVYFGNNLWGIRTAGLYYFGKETENLTPPELLYLLTILRGPNYYKNNQEETYKRYILNNNILKKEGIISSKKYDKNIKVLFSPQNNILEKITTTAAQYILKEKNVKKKSFISTLDIRIQRTVRSFVKESKYPTSIIAIKNKQVVAVASSYGNDYPFISKTNVGSTLKPFLYCFLRNNGISKDEKFSTTKNLLDWEVREVEYYGNFLNLEEALFHSNNNAFINAACKQGIENSFDFLSQILNRELDDFYPSSILGATKNGISLYELAFVYSVFFDFSNLSEIQSECLQVLNRIFRAKTDLNVENVFLKTGTTNNNAERLAIFRDTTTTYAVLRNENPINDNTKDGSFMKSIKDLCKSLFKHNKSDYKWG